MKFHPIFGRDLGARHRPSYPLEKFLSEALAATRGGGKRGRRPQNKNSAPSKLPSIPTQTPFSLEQFQGGVFFWKPTENSERSRPIWSDDLFFGTRRKVQPRNFGSLKQILPPLEQRSI